MCAAARTQCGSIHLVCQPHDCVAYMRVRAYTSIAPPLGVCMMWMFGVSMLWLVWWAMGVGVANNVVGVAWSRMLSKTAIYGEGAILFRALADINTDFKIPIS